MAKYSLIDENESPPIVKKNKKYTLVEEEQNVQPEKDVIPQKATGIDKEQAYKQIKQRFPGMSDILIKGLLPLATKMAETPEDSEPGTATGAFLRSAVRSPLEGAENLASLVGLPTVKEGNYPGLIKESASDIEHPYAEFGGALAGLAAPGAGTIGALRSIPAWGRFIESTSPSILRKILGYGAEGAALGAGFSPEGERLKGGALGALLGAGAGLTPILTKFPSTRKLNKVKKELNKRGSGTLNIPKAVIDDIEQNNFLRNTQANRNLLEKARSGNYQDLFNLQSDMGRLEREYSRNPFSAAERQFGRDIGTSRQGLLDEIRTDIGNQGHKDLSDLMKEGQNQYRQYSQLKPYRNAALITMLAGLPGFKYLKKLMP